MEAGLANRYIESRGNPHGQSKFISYKVQLHVDNAKDVDTYKGEDKEMEDKKYYKDEFQKLGIEDLESVSGGVMLPQMTDEERHELKAVSKKYESAVIDKSKGLCDQSAVDEAFGEYVEFLTKMNNKYN